MIGAGDFEAAGRYPVAGNGIIEFYTGQRRAEVAGNAPGHQNFAIAQQRGGVAGPRSTHGFDQRPGLGNPVIQFHARQGHARQSATGSARDQHVPVFQQGGRLSSSRSMQRAGERPGSDRRVI